MTISTWLICIGLGLNILGAVLLVFFALPNGLQLEDGNLTECEKRKRRLTPCMVRLSLTLLVVGFVLQIVGTVIAGSESNGC